MKIGKRGLQTALLLGVCAFGTNGVIQAGEEATNAAPTSALEIQQTGDVAKLKAQIAEQEKQLERLRVALDEQKRMIEAIMRPGSEPMKPNRLGEVASLAPVFPVTPIAPTPSPVMLPLAMQKSETQAPSPLSIPVGDSFLTPVGFMDFTTVNRTTTSGSGIGTNFGSIPFNNAIGGKLSEMRLSAQNSRVGFRFDSKFKGANILGYLESDFLGNNPGNVAVTSNSDTLRLRMYFVQIKKDKFEVLAGQSWSMLTPGRVGISPIPGDLFYSQDIDVNYQAGLVWSRDPQLRFVYHPSKSLAMGLSLESSEQYVGGSGGGGIIAAPTALAGEFGQFNSGAAVLATPNLHPDIVGKIAYDALSAKDGHSRFHAEIAGVESTFKGFNPITGLRYTKAGGGGSLNLNLEILPGFRIVTNNYVSDGGGRWLFGLAPDLAILGNGDLGLIKASSTVSGAEWTVKKNTLYVYYGGVYIGKYSAIDPANGKPVGYGYTGSANGQNRTVQEGTFGFNETLWKDPRYGAINVMGQYSYLSRAPWYVASGQPKNAHQNQIYFNLRYTLPGATPKIN